MSEFKSQLTLALVFNIALKILTFILTMYLTRQLSAEYSGVNFTYFVFIEALLFVAREAAQNTALRYNVKENDSDDHRNNCHINKSTICNDKTNKESNCSDHDSNVSRISAVVVKQQINFSLVAVPVAVACMCVCELQTFTPLQLFPALSPMWKSASTLEVSANNTYTNTSFSASHHNEHINNSVYSAWFDSHQNTWIAFVLERVPEFMVYLTVFLFALTQPAMVLLQSLDIYRANVVAEFWMIIVRLMTTIVLIKANNNDIHSDWEGRMIFALSHLTSSLAFLVYYVIACAPLEREHNKKSGKLTEALCSAEIQTTSQESKHLMQFVPYPWNQLDLRVALLECRRNAELFESFLTESLAHITLDESEKFAIAALGNTKSRGYYETVSSLGSIAIRLIFCVWERACLARWSREMATGAYHDAVSLLFFMLRLALYIGYFCILLGPLISEQALEVLYSRRWAVDETITSLQLFCYNLPCIGVSGLLENFLRSAASPELLRRYQRCTFVHSAVFLLTCFVGLSVNKSDESNLTRRLIALGIVNHLCRSVCALYFIESITVPVESVGHCNAESKSVIANHTPSQAKLVKMREFTAVLPWQTTIALGVLFVLSRLFTLTSGFIGALCVAFFTCICVLDAEMRGELQVLYNTCFK